MADKDDKAAREERLRRALRDNLKRRKQAARKGDPPGPDKPAGK